MSGSALSIKKGLQTSIKQFLGIAVWIIVTVFEYLFLSGLTNSSEYLQIISWIILANMIGQIITWKSCGKKLVSFFMLILLCLYIFHFGQVVMNGLLPSYTYDYMDYVSVYMLDTNLKIYTLLVSILTINFMFIGGLIPREKQNLNIQMNRVDNDTFSLFARTVFWISIPLRLYLDVKQVIAALAGGYYAAIAVASSGVIVCVANFWYISLPLMYLTLSERKRKAFVVVTVGYTALTMLTGNRGHQFTALMALALTIAISSRQKLGIGRVVKYVLLGVTALYVLDLIFEMREQSISIFLSNPGAFMGNVAKKNIVFETIGTFGETIFTPYLTIQARGNTVNPFFGESFVKSLASIVPDITGSLSKINDEAIFTKNLRSSHTIGGSLVGEFYYNFGLLYPVAAVAFGTIFSKISTKINIALQSQAYNRIVLALPCMTYSLWWVRDSIGNITRGMVWLWLILILVKSVRRNHRSGASIN